MKGFSHKRSIWRRIMDVFCRHKTVKVIRWHRDCVPDEWQGKQLYIDKHLVHNFVMCDCCKKIFNTNQSERLHQQRIEA